MDQNQIKEILEKYRIIAVVGLSKDPKKDSYKVSAYLKLHGYRIIPVNPFVDEVLGEKSYPNLLDIPAEIQKTIEVVDIFRPSNELANIIEQVIKLRQTYGKPLLVWTQLGIIDEKAAEAAINAGVIMIMNKCLMIEHQQLN